MPELGTLRDLASAVQPPPLEALGDVARRRSRLVAVLTGAGAVAAVAVAAVLLVVAPHDGAAVPQPVGTPTATPSSSPSPSSSGTEDTAGASTHASDSSMTLREVVAKPNARLVISGVSPDDPDFRFALWAAPCSWCPNHDEARGRPLFVALAITTDGFATTTYRRSPWDPYRDGDLSDVVSPGPGVLYVRQSGTAGWLVRHDGTVARVSGVVADRVEEEPRRWHPCDGFDDDPQDRVAPVGWCALDPRTATTYQAGPPWLTDQLVLGESAVSPAEADEPWGLRNVHRVAPWWYDGGVLHSRDFGVADVVGTVSGMPRGSIGVWSLDRGSSALTVRTSADLGSSWEVRRLGLPSTPARLGVARTSSGALLALRDGGQTASLAWPPREVWRAERGDDAFDVVYSEAERTDVAGYDSRAFDEVGGRIWSGGLWSEDDGRSWQAVRDWR